MTDHDTLRSILNADQRSASEKERDAAIAKCASFTADYWHEMTKAGLPSYLVDRLTWQFQESYLNALYAPSYKFLTGTGDDDL